MAEDKPDKEPVLVLRRKVDAFFQEIDILIGVHEAWRPMVESEELHRQMGNSFATHTFEFIRLALRREVILGLVRLWDTQRNAVSLEDIGNSLRNPVIVEKLIEDSISAYRGAANGDQEAASKSDWLSRELSDTLEKSIEDTLEQIDRYSKGGERYPIRQHLTKLRNQWLAHRQAEATNPTPPSQFDREVEQCYQDMLELLQALYHSVKKISYNPQDTVAIRARHANLFWRGARGERTEGHPDFKVPVVPHGPDQSRQ